MLGFTTFKDFERDGFRKVIVVHPRSGISSGLTDHGPRASADAFTEFRTGMDHLAFAVHSREELDAWEARLEEVGIEHSPIKPWPWAM